jgi:phage-related protein
MKWEIVFYADLDGKEPVKDFILSLRDGTIAEILHVFKLLREFGTNLSMPYVRKPGSSGIRELRIKHSSDIYRIFYFAYIGKKFVLVHAVTKKQDKLTQNDLDLAISRMYDYKTRY